MITSRIRSATLSGRVIDGAVASIVHVKLGDASLNPKLSIDSKITVCSPSPIMSVNSDTPEIHGSIMTSSSVSLSKIHTVRSTPLPATPVLISSVAVKIKEIDLELVNVVLTNTSLPLPSVAETIVVSGARVSTAKFVGEEVAAFPTTSVAVAWIT